MKQVYLFTCRSLTPNPKLNEIVAAVRSLQGAVQDDTGVSTGQCTINNFLNSFFNLYFLVSSYCNFGNYMHTLFCCLVLGSPPSQPLKSCLAGSHPGSGYLSSAYPSTVQKGTTSGRGKRNGSRKNQFSVFIDNDGMSINFLTRLIIMLCTCIVFISCVNMYVF